MVMQSLLQILSTFIMQPEQALIIIGRKKSKTESIGLR
jgi:hypothetical protein